MVKFLLVSLNPSVGFTVDASKIEETSTLLGKNEPEKWL